jgi:hypothetical protein
MQADYSDLYDIAAFFIGSPDGRVKGRDDLAQQIAEQGRKFAMEHWRWEDMQAYVSVGTTSASIVMSMVIELIGSGPLSRPTVSCSSTRD